MKGKPKFKLKDHVKFWFWERFDDTPWGAELNESNAKKVEKHGYVDIIDKYGTFDDPSDVSYDILVNNDRHFVTVGWGDGEKHIEERVGDCLYKHITERFVSAYEE